MFGIIDTKIETLKGEILELDMIYDTLGLEEEEVINRKEKTTNLFRNLNHRNSLLAQKAKIKWLQEGDINSSFFHRVVNYRRKRNEISGLSFQDGWTEDVIEIKSGVREHFQNQFRRQRGHIPVLAPDLFSKKVSEEDNSMLIEQFTESEALEAINNCESSKKSGPRWF